MNAEPLEIDLLIPDEASLLLNQNQIEKELILEEIMFDMGKGNEFSVTFLIKAIMMLLAIVLVFGMKIYFSNQVYGLSRDIGKLQNERNYLNEQNSILQMKLEKQRFKSDIVDAIF
jgi:hypothetical protein